MSMVQHAASKVGQVLWVPPSWGHYSLLMTQP